MVLVVFVRQHVVVVTDDDVVVVQQKSIPYQTLGRLTTAHRDQPTVG